MEVLARHWTLLALTAQLSRSRAVIAPRAQRAQAADAKCLCESAWHLSGSKQIVMCACERFHRRVSSIDYGARGGSCVFEYRGKISVTLTATAFRDRGALEQLRQIKCLALFEFR